MDRIPNDCILCIKSQLSVRDRLSLRWTSRRLYHISRTTLLNVTCKSPEAAQGLSECGFNVTLNLSHREADDEEMAQWLSVPIRITSLDISHNLLADVAVCRHLTTLSLNLSHNIIMNINALSSLVSLTTLNLATNRIIDISALSSLVSLTTLDLSHNKISNIDALSGLVNLTKLYLACNNVVNIDVLSTLTKLTDLNLYWNYITNVKPLHILTSLRRLDIQGAMIEDAERLALVKILPNTCITHARYDFNILRYDIPPHVFYST